MNFQIYIDRDRGENIATEPRKTCLFYYVHCLPEPANVVLSQYIEMVVVKGLDMRVRFFLLNRKERPIIGCCVSLFKVRFEFLIDREARTVTIGDWNILNDEELLLSSLRLLFLSFLLFLLELDVHIKQLDLIVLLLQIPVALPLQAVFQVEQELVEQGDRNPNLIAMIDLNQAVDFEKIFQEVPEVLLKLLRLIDARFHIIFDFLLEQLHELF